MKIKVNGEIWIETDELIDTGFRLGLFDQIALFKTKEGAYIQRTKLFTPVLVNHGHIKIEDSGKKFKYTLANKALIKKYILSHARNI